MFVLLVLVLVVGVVIGLVRGGTLTALGRIYVTRPRLFLGALAALVLGRLVPGLHSLGWIVATVLMALFAAANSRLPGLSLLLAGLALNAVVVTANGGRMPVTTADALRAGVSLAAVDDNRLLERDPPDPALRVATDVIPLPLPVAPSVVSLGDVLLSAGLGLFGAVAPLRARRTLEARRAERGTARTRDAQHARRAGARRARTRTGTGTGTDSVAGGAVTGPLEPDRNADGATP